MKKKNQQKKRRAIVPLGLVLLIGLVMFLSLPGKKPVGESRRLQRGTITEFVSEPGNVQAQGKYEVYSPNSGIVDQIFVNDGQWVEVGQHLFSVRSDASLTQKQNAYTNYQASLASLGAAQQSRQAIGMQISSTKEVTKTAEASFKTLESKVTENNPEVIHEINAIKAMVDAGSQQVSALERQYMATNQGVRAAESQVQAARIAYETTQLSTVTSPAAGTVSNLSIKIGGQVSARNPMPISIPGSSAVTVSPAMIIGDLSDYYIRLKLNELDVYKVKAGQPVKITLDAFPNQEFKGVVTQVDTFGTESEGAIIYQTEISFPNPPSDIKPEMSALADITTNVKNNVLLVNNQAIKPYQNSLAIQVKTKNNDLEYRKVKLGIRGPQESEVIEGVSDNDEVIISDSE